MKNTNFYLIIVALVFVACETDFEVNADWKESTVVYGLLDQSLDTQSVVIYKAFLGEESAYVIADEADSIYYQSDDLEVLLYEVENNDTLRSIELEYFITDNRNNSNSDNIFSTEYSVEYISTETLNAEYIYHLHVRNLKTGLEVTSSTSLIQEMDFGSTTSSDLNIYDNDEFKIFFLKWKKSANARIYNPILRFYYYEKNVLSGEVSLKYVDKSYANLSPEEFSNNNMQILVDGQSFFYFIKNSIEENNEVLRINAKELEDGFASPQFWTGGVDFLFVLGGESIAQFIEVNNLPGLLFQDPPTYTNIENGIGIFSSRLNDSFEGAKLSDDALLFLSEGELTSELNFLVP